MALLFLIWSLHAHPQDLTTRLEKALHASVIPRSALGLVVIDMTHTPQTELFALHEQQEFTPASVTKLATAAAVLGRLGSTFKFQTTLWTAASVKAGVLDGDLILKGGGDAGFVSETLWNLVNEFVRTGTQNIAGNLVVDDTDFDHVRADPSRDPERVDRAYDAPVGAMSFNWNSINIFVRPTQVGQAPTVYLDPLPEYFAIDNKAKTVNKAGTDLQVSRVGDRVVVRGTIGINHDEQVIYKNIDDPADWAGHNLRYFLAQRGIKVAGKIVTGKKPDGAKLVAKVDSKAVGQAVADMLKFSNNYVAEMLTKNLAAQSGVVPATLAEGMKIIRTELETKMGISSKRFTLINPSGLSRSNRIRPRDLAEILVQAQKNFPTFAEFLAALSIAGSDGTLKKRMLGEEVKGWVRAKTGTMNGIVALAGFAGRKDGQLRAFAFIFNGKTEQDDSARHLFDALATELVQ